MSGKSTDYLENWMDELPENVRDYVPFIYLAIPGTHNSMTYGIKRSSKVAPDADDVIRKVYKVFPIIVRRWSKNQRINITKQLYLGIR